MNISHQVKAINARVKDHRGYADMIFDLSVFIDYTDDKTGSSVGYQIFHKFDTEVEYLEENAFIPFDQITEEQINFLIETLIEEERVGGQMTLEEWAERRFFEIYAEPISKPFAFQKIPQNPVGIGSTPVI
jgi:hypothetical protein